MDRDGGCNVLISIGLSGAFPPGPPEPGSFSVSLPWIDGDPRAGQTLTGQTGTWTRPVTVTGRRWLRDDAPIEGAEGAEYRTVAEDIGARIAFQAEVEDGDRKFVITSAPIAIRAALEIEGSIIQRSPRLDVPVVDGSTILASGTSASDRPPTETEPSYPATWVVEGSFIKSSPVPLAPSVTQSVIGA